MMKNDEILEILSQVKTLAKRYKDLTGKPLGVTGEVAEIAAAQLLDLELARARNSGFDAIKMEDSQLVKYQIKGRCVSKKNIGGQRIGVLSKNNDCDFVLLVLLDEDFETRSIYKAKWVDVNQALDDATRISKARNIRRQLSISKFISIGAKVWSKNTA